MVRRVLRCLIVDDEEPARLEMRRLLSLHPRVQVVGEAKDVDGALLLAGRLRPDVVFLDIALRGESGFDFVDRAKPPLPRVVFVTAFGQHAVRGFDYNALDYLLKPVLPERLAETVKRLEARLPKETALAAPPPPSQNASPGLTGPMGPALLQKLGLTPREAEVLFWIAQGKSNPEIAIILESTTGTVKKQVQSILRKLQVESRVNAALIAAKALGLSRG